MFWGWCQVDSEPSVLAISGNSNLAEHGGWERRVSDVTPGAWYKLVAYYRAEAVPSESWQVVARFDWRTANNGRVGEPVPEVERQTTIVLRRPARERGTQAVALFGRVGFV